MAFFGLFKKDKKDASVKVSQQKQNTMQDSAVAATFAEAGEHDTARSMVDKSKGKNTILVIAQDELFSEKLISYALGMAKRLEYELMVANATDAPLSLPEGEREEAMDLFTKKCMESTSAFKERAAADGVKFTHIVELGMQETVIDKLHKQYPGMRYVLTEPDPDLARNSEERDSIPVFDLCSYRSAVA